MCKYKFSLPASISLYRFILYRCRFFTVHLIPVQIDEICFFLFIDKDCVIIADVCLKFLANFRCTRKKCSARSFHSISEKLTLFDTVELYRIASGMKCYINSCLLLFLRIKFVYRFNPLFFLSLCVCVSVSNSFSIVRDYNLSKCKQKKEKKKITEYLVFFLFCF